jgi:hypothetical protein
MTFRMFTGTVKVVIYIADARGSTQQIVLPDTFTVTSAGILCVCVVPCVRFRAHSNVS